MFRLNSLIKSFSICCLSAAGLVACDPEFTTTSQECLTFDPVTLAVPNFTFQAVNPNNEYKLYLEDALNSLSGAQSTTGNTAGDTSVRPLSQNEQDALDFIFSQASTFLGYEIENGKVISATNALDFMESLIAATDSDETIQTFVNAKNNVARAIAKGDSVCNFRNSAIVVREERPLPNNPELTELVSFFNAQLDINFNPFNTDEDRNVDQVVLIALNEPITGMVEDNVEAQRLLNSFNGFQRVSATDFNATGISPPEVRQLTVSNFDTNETFFFDDDFDTLKLGQLISTRFNRICRDDNNQVITCPENIPTRTPQHPACLGNEALRTWLQGKCPLNPTSAQDRHPGCPSDGGPADEAIGQDETGQVELLNFTAVEGFDDLTDIQRLRLEVDYPKNEIRLYASEYAEAMLRASAISATGEPKENFDPVADVIINPTNCEQQAVLDDLAYQAALDGRFDEPGFTGVRLTLIEDPKYDLKEIRNDDGDVISTIEPTPIFTFRGTPITERQTDN